MCAVVLRMIYYTSLDHAERNNHAEGGKHGAPPAHAYHPQGQFQLLPPLRPRTTPFPEEKSIPGVICGVLLWADMNAATPLGAWGCSGIGSAHSHPARPTRPAP